MQMTTQIAENHATNAGVDCINHIHITRALFDEGMRAAESAAYKKAIRKMALILFIIYLAVAIWLLHTGGSLIFLLGESIFLGALLFWLTVMLPGTRRKSKYKAMMQGGNDIPERTVKFYQNHLSVLAHTGKETLIQYKDIQNWKETKHLYILSCNNKMSVLLDKNGFVTGDFQTIKNVIFS